MLDQLTHILNAIDDGDLQAAAQLPAGWWFCPVCRRRVRAAQFEGARSPDARRPRLGCHIRELPPSHASWARRPPSPAHPLL